MTPIRETGRFPGLYKALVAVASTIFAIITLYLVFLLWKRFLCPNPNLIELCSMIGVLSTIGLVVTIFIFIKIAFFTINHLAGRPVFEEPPPKTSSVYAYGYLITATYTLPFAYNGYDRDGDPYCNLYLSLSYAEICNIYQYLRRRHRVFCCLHTLSLPSYLGKRTPIITRNTAKRLLQTMLAANANIPVERQRVILQYSFYPSYPENITLPEHEVFLSRNIISELLSSLTSETGQIPSGAELIVGINTSESIRLTARYLQECYTRVSADNELIFIPIT